MSPVSPDARRVLGSEGETRRGHRISIIIGKTILCLTGGAESDMDMQKSGTGSVETGGIADYFLFF